MEFCTVLLSRISCIDNYGLPNPYNLEFFPCTLNHMENSTNQPKMTRDMPKMLILMVILGFYIAAQ